MTRIAITGHRGRLGSQLARHDPSIFILNCDITNPIYIHQALEEVKPDVVINCAAFTDVDACETDDGWKKASAVNLWSVERLRTAYAGRLIHISTDYIFSGKNGAYSEKWGTEENPVNLYGSSKLGGEICLLNSEHKERESLIVRTTGLFGGASRKPDLVATILTSLDKCNPLYMTNELRGNQTYIPFLAEALLQLCNMDWKYPVVNIGSDEVISRYEFALMVAGVYGLDKELIHPCKNRDIKSWVAPRPTKGGLKVTRAKKWGLPIYSVLDGIKAYKEAKQYA